MDLSMPEISARSPCVRIRFCAVKSAYVPKNQNCCTVEGVRDMFTAERKCRRARSLLCYDHAPLRAQIMKSHTKTGASTAPTASHL